MEGVDVLTRKNSGCTCLHKMKTLCIRIKNFEMVILNEFHEILKRGEMNEVHCKDQFIGDCLFGNIGVLIRAGNERGGKRQPHMVRGCASH
jgi:hypothetical protein